MKNNCLIFAFHKWIKCGGYLIIRKSNYGWWPHFLWSKDLSLFEEFAPSSSKYQGRWFPPLIFAGYIRKSYAWDQSKVD